MGQETHIGGDKFGKKASCGSRSSYRRRQIWEESLLWVKKLTQEEINLERKPPVGQEAHIGGETSEELPPEI